MTKSLEESGDGLLAEHAEIKKIQPLIIPYIMESIISPEKIAKLNRRIYINRGIICLAPGKNEDKEKTVKNAARENRKIIFNQYDCILKTWEEIEQSSDFEHR